MKKSGLYYWAGPGTIRMIGLKFFNPSIDTEGLMRGYDADVLSSLQNTLGTTDAWVSYSWGFSDQTELEDRQFLRAKLGNFQALGIRTHAYVQGMNLVCDEHPGLDFYCRDHAGKLIPYHRGRALCCPLNPDFRALLLKRVSDACVEDVDGVFIDNFHFGQIPLPLGKHVTFFGCYCDYCRSAYMRLTGTDIPLARDLRSPETSRYIAFRCDVMAALAEEITALAHHAGKEFGANTFDLDLPPALMYGVDIERHARAADYLLAENFNYPSKGRSNAKTVDIARATGKPLFIVSYKQPIGRHALPRQKDINAVCAESKALGYHPCHKASEFTTAGTWHGIDPEALSKPEQLALKYRRTRSSSSMNMPFSRQAAVLINRIDNAFLTKTYERRWFRRCTSRMLDAIVTRSLR